jgi:hypothetical protein
MLMLGENYFFQKKEIFPKIFNVFSSEIPRKIPLKMWCCTKRKIVRSINKF